MKNRRTSPFTLVEVLIAMGICVIGICSIMVLFPVGANASREASMSVYAANAAEQMLKYAKLLIVSDDSGNAFKHFTGWTLEDKSTYEDGSKQEPEGTLNEKDISAGSVSDDVKKILETHDTKLTAYDNNVYKLDFVTDEFEDFSCFISMWPTAVRVDDGDNTSPVIGRTVNLNVEVSWPADLEYDLRQKATYSLFVFKPE